MHSDQRVNLLMFAHGFVQVLDAEAAGVPIFSEILKEYGGRPTVECSLEEVHKMFVRSVCHQAVYAPNIVELAASGLLDEESFQYPLSPTTVAHRLLSIVRLVDHLENGKPDHWKRCALHLMAFQRCVHLFFDQMFEPSLEQDGEYVSVREELWDLAKSLYRKVVRTKRVSDPHLATDA